MFCSSSRTGGRRCCTHALALMRALCCLKNNWKTEPTWFRRGLPTHLTRKMRCKLGADIDWPEFLENMTRPSTVPSTKIIRIELEHAKGEYHIKKKSPNPCVSPATSKLLSPLTQIPSTATSQFVFTSIPTEQQLKIEECHPRSAPTQKSSEWHIYTGPKR